jgi:hypothetical protein
MAKARKRTESASIGSTAASMPDAPADVMPESDLRTGNGDHRDRVAMRAYELYLARGGSHGGDFDDWLAAEREVAGDGNAGKGDAGE